MNAASRRLVWSIAGATLWAGIDLMQVAVSTGGQPLGRLAVVVVPFYLIAALGLIVMPFAAPAAPRRPAADLATAIVVPGAALATAHINFVHLPDFLTPVTLGANAMLLLSAALAWLFVARSVTFARVAASLAAGAVVTAVGTALVLVSATGYATVGKATLGISAGADRPNVFIVTIDSLRADRVFAISAAQSAAGMPALRSLAARGTVFDKAYAHASWTKPSVASLMTSLHPSTHGANLRRDRLSSEAVTIPEIFAAGGYRTAIFSANPWISPAFGFDRGVTHFVESDEETFSRLVLILRALRAVDRPLPGHPLSRVIATAESVSGLRGARHNNCERDELLLGAFESWLGGPGEAPAFAYFHFMSPHIPYDPPTGDRGFSPTTQVELLMRTEPLTADRQKLLLALYDETVVHADGILASLVSVLERHGIADRSLIVVTADHGEEFFEHGRFGHGKTLYDEVIHVPLVIAGPGVPAGIRRDDIAAHVDLAPTLATLAGLPSTPAWVGRDLLRDTATEPAYGELLREGGLEIFMTTDGKRKFIETTQAMGARVRAEVFDLSTDKEELRPLDASPEDDLRSDLSRLRQSARDAALAREDTAIDSDAEERLRALGYIN